MIFRIVKIALFIIILSIASAVSVFFVRPASLVDMYRGEDEKTIWIKIKHTQFKKNIIHADYLIAPNVKWSSNGRYFSFYDFVRLEWATKEWALKVVDARTLKIKTVFIGDYKTSEYNWINNENIRVYEDAGSGVRIYRDININIPEPFIATDHMSPEYWTPEKTF